MYNLSVGEDLSSVLISGESILAFESLLGYEKLSNKECKVDLTKENALSIRTFLAGKSFKLNIRDQNILRFIADSEEDAKLRVEKLTNLKNNTLTKKHGKIKTEWDLIHYVPLRYIDKSNPQKISDLELGQWAVVVGTVSNDPSWDPVRKLVKIVVQDIENKRISATFFSQKWLAWQYKQGDNVILYGNYSEYVNQKGGRFPQITNAKIDKLNDVKGDVRMVPVYPQKDGDKSWKIQQDIKKLHSEVAWYEDPVPEHILKKYELMSRNEAYRKIHFPSSPKDMEAARKRIAFDEFVRLQVYFYNLRNDKQSVNSKPKNNLSLAEQYRSALPFKFTNAQQRVTQEIAADMESEKPSVRLLQGDVGAGKSEVAAYAMLIAAGSQQQVALLAPTDILASQLYDRFTKDFARAGITIESALLTGKTTAKERSVILESLKSGNIKMLVGTHAIIQDGVVFDELGLLVIDEQHKFGIEQRSKLHKVNEQGHMPDLLVMSATPIPRTMSQVMYGDMDISILDELPEGRQPITTYWVQQDEDAWEQVEAQIALGRQAYIIAPLVDESDKLENVESAISLYETLSNKRFSKYNVGLMHGKLPAKEKSAVMEDFVTGKTQILVSTTVIEVGVNVPNATVIAIMNANRFGISSLHQMRGRVGRGKDKSYCYLVGEATTPDAEERLNALVESNDGFWLAEKDLEIRGEGQLFGSIQSGESDTLVANLREHKDLLETAKKVAKAAASSVDLNNEIDILYKNKTVGR